MLSIRKEKWPRILGPPFQLLCWFGIHPWHIHPIQTGHDGLTPPHVTVRHISGLDSPPLPSYRWNFSINCPHKALELQSYNKNSHQSCNGNKTCSCWRLHGKVQGEIEERSGQRGDDLSDGSYGSIPVQPERNQPKAKIDRGRPDKNSHVFGVLESHIGLKSLAMYHINCAICLSRCICSTVICGGNGCPVGCFGPVIWSADSFM